ncbi:hypothetical protein, partial [Porphyromonas levii]|uniref:hypothetical protein n=1 Tax=Porphyromonas levii TaxID=28114 RepID=UPI001B8AA1A4
ETRSEATSEGVVARNSLSSPPFSLLPLYLCRRHAADRDTEEGGEKKVLYKHPPTASGFALNRGIVC